MQNSRPRYVSHVESCASPCAEYATAACTSALEGGVFKVLLGINLSPSLGGRGLRAPWPLYVQMITMLCILALQNRVSHDKVHVQLNVCVLPQGLLMPKLSSWPTKVDSLAMCIAPPYSNKAHQM